MNNNLEQLKKENREKCDNEFGRITSSTPNVSLAGEMQDFIDHITTTSYQAGIDEAVEVVKSLKKPFSLSTFIAEIRNKWGDEFDDVMEEMAERSQSEHDYYNQALDDTIKALQDDK